MTVTISPGLSEAVSVSYTFDFDFPWLGCRFAETKKQWKQNVQIHWNTGSCCEAGARKLMLKMRVLDSVFQAPLVSSWYPDSIHVLQSDSSHDFCWIAKLSFFFLCLPRNFIIHPQYNTFITHSFIQWAFPGRHQWTGALALSLCFTVTSLCNFMEGSLPLWASFSLFSSVDFGMWSQWKQETCLLVHFASLVPRTRPDTY